MQIAHGVFFGTAFSVPWFSVNTTPHKPISAFSRVWIAYNTHLAMQYAPTIFLNLLGEVHINQLLITREKL